MGIFTSKPDKKDSGKPDPVKSARDLLRAQLPGVCPGCGNQGGDCPTCGRGF